MVEHHSKSLVQHIAGASAGITPQVSEADREIHAARAELLRLYSDKMATLDPSQHWAAVVTTARAAGLEKETFRQEFSCAWSTVTRWMNGETLPGKFARGAMRDRLVELVREMRDREAAKATGLAAGDALKLRDVPGVALHKASPPHGLPLAASAPSPRPKPAKAGRAAD